MPRCAGVYQFLDKKNNVLYVGKAINLRKRVSSYFQNKNALGEKTASLVEKIKKIRIIEVYSEIEALLLEANYIKKYSPYYNARFKDGKSYPFIKITINDLYPKVLIARKIDDPKALFFGPYINSSAMRLVLKTLRRIFPFESVKNHHKSTCLYYHLGLCPCASFFNTKEEKIKYKITIRRIIKFLEGKIQNVVRDLENERNNFSKNEKFEEAHKIQKTIDSIKIVTTSFTKPFEYEINPNLKVDILNKELTALKIILLEKGIKLKSLERIECFDISNLQGKNATGSMVVFINGEKDSSLYRKFKIRFTSLEKPNDYEMMSEVIQRRIKHNEWEYPNLIIVDGGKGQVSSALKKIEQFGFKIPVIGLAKKEETIIIPTGDTLKQEYKEIKLPYNSPALKLIQRIRDEAHRFAINYHRKLRSKQYLS